MMMISCFFISQIFDFSIAIHFNSNKTKPPELKPQVQEKSDKNFFWVFKSCLITSCRLTPFDPSMLTTCAKKSKPFPTATPHPVAPGWYNRDDTHPP